MNRSRRGILVLFTFLLLSGNAHAARISEVADFDLADRAIRFFTFQDASLRYALIGSILLGISCGLMGSFLVVRRLSLMSDTLSHAVLPGVALGYLWSMTKNPIAIFIGATVCGLLGSGLVQAIRNRTRQKEDAALGFVLSSFFAVGVCLMTMIQNLPGGNKSGLDKFMFGQAAALGATDLWLLGGVTVLAVLLLTLFYKEMLVTSFDSGFARSVGIRSNVFHYLLMLLLAFAIVSALQAVGVVLVSAMLVIPAATAFLLTDRFQRMMILSAAFGMITGAVGAFFSFVGRNLPTGPLMVLAAALVFTSALFFAPRHGIVARWLKHRKRSRKIRRENALKNLYHLLENGRFERDSVTLKELADQRSETLEEAEKLAHLLKKSGFITQSEQTLRFTPEGWRRACEIVRNHRLWELYLTQAARFASDHVHDDAEEIEHILSEDTIRKLELRLNHARRDPHGKLIPGLKDIQAGPISRPS
ncbi:MAG: iron chelate uptake ABC transporter family permease subunit [Luteolibacter sp.]